MNLHISNTTKVWFFLVAISLGILFLGYNTGGRLGLFISFLLMSFLNFIVFIYGKAQIIKKLDAKLQSGQDPWRINEKLENFSKVLAMEKPLLFIVEEPTAIAFSLATPWQNASIGLSTGLINKLTEDELNTVLAHEICHIQRHDAFAFSVSSSIANTFIGLAQFLDQFWIINLMQNRMVQRPFLTMLSPIAWLIIRLTLSEKNFIENDELAAALIQDKKKLATVLWKLDGLTHAGLINIPPCSSHLFIVNPLGVREKNWFYLTHPSIETRIQKLIGYFPI